MAGYVVARKRGPAVVLRCFAPGCDWGMTVTPGAVAEVKAEHELEHGGPEPRRLPGPDPSGRRLWGMMQGGLRAGE